MDENEELREAVKDLLMHHVHIGHMPKWETRLIEDKEKGRCRYAVVMLLDGWYSLDASEGMAEHWQERVDRVVQLLERGR